MHMVSSLQKSLPPSDAAHLRLAKGFVLSSSLMTLSLPWAIYPRRTSNSILSHHLHDTLCQRLPRSNQSASVPSSHGNQPTAARRPKLSCSPTLYMTNRFVSHLAWYFCSRPSFCVRESIGTFGYDPRLRRQDLRVESNQIISCQLTSIHSVGQCRTKVPTMTDCRFDLSFWVDVR